jgi:predicted nucleotidyltransferase
MSIKGKIDKLKVMEDNINMSEIDYRKRYKKTIEKLEKNGIEIDYSKLIPVCNKYYINKLLVFGSALRDDFKKGKSDIDLLVDIEENKFNSGFIIFEIQEEFEKIFEKKIDIFTLDGVTEFGQGYYSVKHINKTKKEIYGTV